MGGGGEKGWGGGAEFVIFLKDPNLKYKNLLFLGGGGGGGGGG